MSKFKSIFILLAVFAIVLTVGGSIAYFSDAKESTSVFTVGSVYISLTEAEVKDDGRGNLIEDTAKDRINGADLGAATEVNYGRIFPGQTITKDPTIKNTGDDSAWVCAKVIIEDGSKDIHKLFGYEGYDEIDIESLLGGGLLDESVHVGRWNGIDDVCYNDRYAMVQVADKMNGKYEFYFFILDTMEKDEEVVIFDTLFIDPLFDNTEMLELSELRITVQAFAVQEFGFEDCINAMRGAFGTHFENCVSN